MGIERVETPPSANHRAAVPESSSDTDAEPPSRASCGLPSLRHESSLCPIDWQDRRPPGGEAASIAVDLAWLRVRGEAVAAELPRPLGRVSIALIDDAEMDRLHRNHCGIAGTTDVLTYPDEASEAGELCGDLAISVEVAAREADARRRRLEVEILLYAVHGLLHLAGERDDTAEAAAAMRAAQDRVMRALGLPGTDEESVA